MLARDAIDGMAALEVAVPLAKPEVEAVCSKGRSYGDRS